MTTLDGSTDIDKLHSLCSKTYKEQAVWFLNAYWDSYSDEAELFWNYVEKVQEALCRNPSKTKSLSQCAELDVQKHGDGSGLDEAVAHRFLEVLHETLTVMAMRERLRKTGALSPSERPKLVPLTHYLLFKHEGVDWKVLVNTKGDNSAEIAEAQRLLDAVLLQAKIYLIVLTEYLFRCLRHLPKLSVRRRLRDARRPMPENRRLLSRLPKRKSMLPLLRLKRRRIIVTTGPKN